MTLPYLFFHPYVSRQVELMPRPRPKSYAEWEQSVLPSLKLSPVWRLHVYRNALFLATLAWHDSRKVVKREEVRPLASQLYRAVCSIVANLAEGYGRNSGKDRQRFYEYAYTSAMEAQHWYVNVQDVLEDAVVRHRTNALAIIIHQILALIPHQRNLREEAEAYNTGTEETDSTLP